MRYLLAGALCLLAVGPVLAESGEEIARSLHEGEIEPEQAARGWAKARLKPAKVVKLLNTLRPWKEGRQEDYEIELKDTHGRETDARVSVPPEPGSSGYPVVILLHGLGGDSKQGFTLGRALIPKGSILICPSAQRPPADVKYEDLRISGAFGIPIMKRFKHWWSYQPDAFPLQALGYLERRYPLDRDRIVLVGYSMGGFGTWNLGLRYHDRFAGIVPLAGGVSREEFALGRDSLVRKLLVNARNVSTYFVHGDEDEVVPVKFDRWSKEDLTKLGVEFTYREIEKGKHVLPPTQLTDVREELADWIPTRRRDPHPKKVVHVSIGSYHAAAYWVRIDAQTGASGKIVAEVLGKNRIKVETEGVTKLTVYLDPELVKVKKTVTVALNGKLAFQGRVPESLEAVAETWDRTHDPALTYTRAVELEVK